MEHLMRFLIAFIIGSISQLGCGLVSNGHELTGRICVAVSVILGIIYGVGITMLGLYG